MRLWQRLMVAVASVSLLALGVAVFMPDTQAGHSNRFQNSHFKGTYAGFFSGFAPNLATGVVEYGVVTAILIADGRGGAVGTIYPNPPGTSVVAGSPPTGVDPGGGIAFDSPVGIRPDGTGFAEVTFPELGPNVVFNVAFVLTDVRGGVAHRVLFNQNTGDFRAGGFLIRQHSKDDD